MRVALGPTLVTLLVSGAFAVAHPQRATGAVAARDLDLGDLIQPQQLSDVAAAFRLADTDASDPDATTVLAPADAAAAPDAASEGDQGSQTNPDARGSQHCHCNDATGTSTASFEGLSREEIRAAVAGASHGRKLSQAVDLATIQNEIFVITELVAAYEIQLAELNALLNAEFITSLAFSPGSVLNPTGRRLLSNKRLMQANLKEASKLRGQSSKPDSSTA